MIDQLPPRSPEVIPRRGLGHQGFQIPERVALPSQGTSVSHGHNPVSLICANSIRRRSRFCPLAQLYLFRIDPDLTPNDKVLTLDNNTPNTLR